MKFSGADAFDGGMIKEGCAKGTIKKEGNSG